jgi:transcription elongation GreA/GreB family factor
MTSPGLERLQAEIDHINGRQRPPLAEAVARLQAPGTDASSTDLKTARHNLAAVDRRLEYLNELRRSAEVVHPGRGPADRVSFASTVRVRDKMSGDESRYTIVGVYEADPSMGWISWISPIAKALKGKSAGDTVLVALPGDEKVLKILEIAPAEF